MKEISKLPEMNERYCAISVLQKMLFEELTATDIKVFYHFMTVCHRKETEFADIHDKNFFQWEYISNSDCLCSIDKLIKSKMIEKITDTEYKVLWHFNYNRDL
jgi:hypothetical protein